MVESLFSHSWYRVENLKPRLRGHAQIHRHNYRGKDWYVLQDHSTGRFHRFSKEAYLIIGLMDGKRTLDRIWEAACSSLGDDMPTQDEVIMLLSQLHKADVLQSDMPPDIADLHQRHVKQKRSRLLGQLKSPMAIRIPLIDPERFLSATQFLARPFFGWFGALLWLGVVVSALVLAALHWEELTSNLADRVLAMENLFLLWFVYPVVKAFHEFGHAYAVKRWGGEVHEMGLMFLVFVPVPYVDASSSSAFWEKRKRIMVGAAGILTEAFLAGLAMLVWVNVEPGTVRALAFNTMIIAGVSTILFNGNPLLRFDAYYILSDYLEIPNLGSRANRYIGYLLQTYLFNVKDVQSPATAPGEAPWLTFYSIGAFIYRLFIVVRIALFVASKFFFVGVLLAAWGVISMLVIPTFKVLRFAFTDPGMQKRKGRVILMGGLCLGLLACALLVLRVPSFTVAEGVLWASENSQVHAGADGFVTQVLASSGQKVSPGDPLLRCENPDLAAEIKALEAELREFQYKHRYSVTRDRTEAEILKDEIGRIEAELERKRVEEEEMIIRSPAAGTFLIQNPEDMPDRFLRRGMPLGYVVDFSKVNARIVVPQRDVDRIRKDTKKVTIRLAESADREYPAIIKREMPAASRDLPSLALSLEGGGSLALDPTDNQTLKAFDTLFQFEVRILGAHLKSVGERVYVRFEHEPEAIAFRWYRKIRRTLLSRFNV